MGFTVTYVVMMVMANALMVHAQECIGLCNMVFCGEDNFRYVVYGSTAGKCRSECKKNCLIGTVIYQSDVLGACPNQTAIPSWTNIKSWTKDVKRKCMRKMTRAETGKDNNKLDRCFKKVNEDRFMMKTTNSSCNYTVVVVASQHLKNADVEALKEQAKILKDKHATIRCYLLGKVESELSPTYDSNYDEICDGKIKQVRHGGYCREHTSETCEYNRNMKGLFDDLNSRKD